MAKLSARLLLLLSLIDAFVYGFNVQRSPWMQSSSLLFAHDQDTSRRKFVTSFILSAGASIVNPLTSSAVTRAVGSGEESCRAAGNCLEVGEWDGAVGWSWGGKERCDPTDPLCGADGSLRESLKGKPVPRPVSDITHIALIRVDIGRKESGVLKLGLYGNDCPGSTSELIEFLSQGLSTFAKEENTMRLMTTPVSLATGGVVSFITPGSIVELGVPSQSNAYGRSRGLSQVDAFVPQKRPDEGITVNDKIVRSHDAAGLLSLSLKGLGYGGTGFETDDECYESAFIITADSDSAPSLNKNRRVVGQILDSDSMAFLERLANLPTKRGIRGVIPGQTMGPPLLHVTVRDIAVSKVNGSASQQSNAS